MTARGVAQIVEANRDAIALARAYHHNHTRAAAETIQTMTHREQTQTLIAAAHLLRIAAGEIAAFTGCTTDTYFDIILDAITKTAGPPKIE